MSSKQDDVMRTFRRAVLVLAVALGWAAAGSGVFASSALAGGVDSKGNLTAAVYNATPYPMTLVAANAPNLSPNNCGNPSLVAQCWNTPPASTIPPGGAALWSIAPYENDSPGICFGNYRYYFDAFFTYEVDVLGGPPEYQTFAVSGQSSYGPWVGACTVQGQTATVRGNVS